MQEAVRARSTAQIAGHPIHAMLVPIPIACFIGALLVADDSGNTEPPRTRRSRSDRPLKA